MQRQQPDSRKKPPIQRASEFGRDSKPSVVAGELGNGSRITALDTVPFCLWSAARTDDFEDALWYTVGVLGDRDTNCAIVGGILASSAEVAIPERWTEAREPL